MVDPYETQRPWEEWDAQQEAALDDLGFTDEWWIDRVMQQGIAEMEEEKDEFLHRSR
ncbi:MAG: hypothetical protein ABIJ26_05105 [Candidatus Margulisiibacteriota bacterium]